MKIRYIILVVLVAALSTSLFAAERVSPRIDPLQSPMAIYDIPKSLIIAPVDRLPISNELDEYLGDTLWVGRTYHDVQHNSTVGRMVQYDPDSNFVHVTYTDLLAAAGVTRHVMYNRIGFDDNVPVLDHDPYTVDAGDRAGFSTLAMCQNAVNPVPIPVYHGRGNSNDQFNTKVAAEYTILPGIFLEYAFPWEQEYQIIWPKSCMDGDSIIHVLSTTTGADPGENWYTRVAFNTENFSFSITNNDGAPEMSNNRGEFISGTIACSPDGERVAVASLINRAKLLDEEARQWFDQDLYIWINEDRGNDWDWDLENAINVTDFIDPDPEFLPDSVVADQDTFRCYMDVSLFFDEDNLLHVSFSTLEYFYYEDNGFIFGQLWYWNEEDRDVVRVADGNFSNNTFLGVNNISVQRPSLYKDPESGWLYILYQQFGIPGDTLTEGENIGRGRDRSAGDFMNAELFITASIPQYNPGYYWVKGVNVTNSRGTSGEIPAGECQHERDPSIALNNDGDYLHIFYLLDLDAGVSLAGNPEGVGTDNPQIYQRIAKSDLRDSLSAQNEWVRGLPIHIDERDYWEDPNDWEWNVKVEEGHNSAKPESFDLLKVYPNPFNSSARIEFEMPVRGYANIRIYDLLGRTAMTLLDKNLEAGRHEVSFNADNLASGIYFIKLENNLKSTVRKVVLIK